MPGKSARIENAGVSTFNEPFNTMQALLIPLDGGEIISIDKDVTLVGRKRGLCDLIVDRGSVSKLQCLIVKTDGLLFIRDLASTNGTKVNGQKITRGALLPGDELAFASVKYRVHLGPGEPEVRPDDQTEAMTSFPESSPAGSSGPFRNDSTSQSDVRLLSDDSLA